MSKIIGLSVSGGGAFGAYGAGFTAYKIMAGRQYTLFSGSSTGALITPIAAVKDIGTLKKGYTKTTNSDIWVNNPFRVNGDKIELRKINATIRTLRGRRTLGNSERLLPLIRKLFTPQKFEDLQRSNKEVVVAVSSLDNRQVEYKSSKAYEWEDFTEWMYGSCLVAPFTSLLSKDGQLWMDGGLYQHVPIQHIINMGAEEVDVIMHRTETSGPQKQASNLLEVSGQIVSGLMQAVSELNVDVGRLKAKNRDVKLNFYWMPDTIRGNSLDFNSEKMSTWWDLGWAMSRRDKHLEVTLTPDDHVFYRQK